MPPLPPGAGGCGKGVLEGPGASGADGAVGSGLAGGVTRGPPGRDAVVKGSDGVEGSSLERGCLEDLEGALGCQGRGWAPDLRAGGRTGCPAGAGSGWGGAATPGRGELRGQAPSRVPTLGPGTRRKVRPLRVLFPAHAVSRVRAFGSHDAEPGTHLGLRPGGPRALAGVTRGRPGRGVDPREHCPCLPSAPQPHGEQPLRLVGRAEPGQLPAERGLREREPAGLGAG